MRCSDTRDLVDDKGDFDSWATAAQEWSRGANLFKS